MKTPPFLLFAALLFWGWQSDFLLVGALLGAALESARFIPARWDLDDTDFNRIWSFCVLLTVVLAGYVFTNNDSGGLSGLMHGDPVANVANAGALTVTRFLRWLPMTTFAFMVAQTFNGRPSVPLTAVSMVLRWRRRRGDRALAGHYLDIAFPYFMVCLFSAGIHTNNGSQIFFWGQGALVTWALWSLRSRRFGLGVWFLALALVIGQGFLGEFGIYLAQRGIQNFNAEWMARFFGNPTDPLQSLTSMGRIGKLKLSAKIVIRLQPEKIGYPPAYLREASYRIYGTRNQTWNAGSRLNDFTSLQPEPDNQTWVLRPGNAGGTVVNIACYLNGRSKDHDPEGVLPLPSGCCRLENLPLNSSLIALQKNQTGAVLATGAGLMIFNARYGPGATLDAPPDDAATNSLDLAVPTNEALALQQVLTEMKLSDTTAEPAQLLAIEKFFFDKFTYSIWLGEDKKVTATATPLTRFLLTSRTGHCEYFATATVLLLRQLGIPARYAVGYAVHETSGSGYVVRERDAHAWCLVWNRQNRTWEDFDTTPPSWIGIESQRTSLWEWFLDLKSWLGFQFEKFRWRQAHLQQYIFWSLVPVLIVLLYHIIFRRRGKLRAPPKSRPAAAPPLWPGLDSEFYQLEKKLGECGIPRAPDEPLAHWLDRALAEPALAVRRAPLQKLLELHYRHRFDPHGLTAAERQRLKHEAQGWLDSLAGPAPPAIS
jgi:hypothetical protein